MNSEREVSEAEGVELAARFGCTFAETFATTAQNVDRVFANIVRELRGHERAVTSDVVGQKPEGRKKSCIVL